MRSHTGCPSDGWHSKLWSRAISHDRNNWNNKTHSFLWKLGIERKDRVRFLTELVHRHQALNESDAAAPARYIVDMQAAYHMDPQ